MDDMGMRFLLNFDIGGQGERQLARINGLLDQTASKAVAGAGQAFSRLTEGVQGTYKAVGNLGATMGLETLSSKVESLNDSFVNAAKSATDMFQGIMREAATFEDIQSDLKFAFGNKSGGIFEQVKSDAADLTFSLSEVAGLAASLGRFKINPFGGESEASQKFLSKTGQQVRALSVLQDTADAAGKSTQDLTIAIRNAMSGQWLSLQTRFDLPVTMIKKLKAETASMVDPQQKYNALIKELGLMFGGAGAGKAENFNKNMAQIPDLIQQIKGGAGEAGLKEITKGVKVFVESLTGLVKNESSMKAFSDAFLMVANGVKTLTMWAAKAVDAITAITAKYPWLPKFAVAIAGIVIVGGILTTTIIGVGIALAGVAALLMTIGLPLIIAGIALSIAMLIAGVVALGSIFILASGAMTGFKDKGSGIADFLERMKVLIDAVREVMANWSGDMGWISMETRENLEKMGVADTFLKIVGWIQKAKQFFTDFKDEFLRQWDTIKGGVGDAIGRMVKQIEILGVAFGMTMGEAQNGVQGTESAGTKMGATMAKVVGGVANGIVGIIDGLILMMEKLPDIIDGFAEVWHVVNRIITVVKLLALGVGGVLYLAVAGVHDVIKGILVGFKALIAAAKAWYSAKRGEGGKDALAAIDKTFGESSFMTLKGTKFLDKTEKDIMAGAAKDDASLKSTKDWTSKLRTNIASARGFIDKRDAEKLEGKTGKDAYTGADITAQRNVNQFMSGPENYMPMNANMVRPDGSYGTSTAPVSVASTTNITLVTDGQTLASIVHKQEQKEATKSQSVDPSGGTFSMFRGPL